MSDAPEVRTTKSDTYKEIHVTGQIANLTYDGLRLAVLHDAPDLTETVDGDRFDVSRMVIDRKDRVHADAVPDEPEGVDHYAAEGVGEV